MNARFEKCVRRRDVTGSRDVINRIKVYLKDDAKSNVNGSTRPTGSSEEPSLEPGMG